MKDLFQANSIERNYRAEGNKQCETTFKELDWLALVFGNE